MFDFPNSIFPSIEDRIHLIWAKTLISPFTPLTPVLLREISTFLGSLPLLMSVSRDRITTFNLKTLQTATNLLDEWIEVDSYSVWIPLSPATVFLCGTTRLATYLTHNNPSYLLRNTSVSRLPGLNYDIRCPGAALIRQKVYLFGGYEAGNAHLGSKRRKAVFAFDFSEENWRSEGEMRVERSNFNPCGRGFRVYLCGGYANSCEIFDTNILQSTLLDIVLPADSKLAYCTATVCNDSLIVITSTSLSCYLLPSHQQIASKQHENYHCWSSCPPIVYANSLVIVDKMADSATVLQICLQTGSVLCASEMKPNSSRY